MKVKKSTKSSKKQSFGRDRQTRLEIFGTLTHLTGLRRAELESVFFSMSDIIEAHMKKGGSGEFLIPVIGIKIRRVKKKATKARKMLSPLTGKLEEIKARPARFGVKASVLYPLRDAASK